MLAAERSKEEKIFLYIGAICAILGTVLSVLAGIGYGELSALSGTEAVLRLLNSRPDWYWPAVQLSFSLGAILWLGALSALTYSLKSLTSWIVGRLGTASIVLGTTIHLIHAAISGYSLTILTDSWAAAPLLEQITIVQAGTQLLIYPPGGLDLRHLLFPWTAFYTIRPVCGLKSQLSSLAWLARLHRRGRFICFRPVAAFPTYSSGRTILYRFCSTR